MKILLLWILLGLTNLTFGQDVKEVPKDFSMLTSECHNTLVNMISGKLVQDKGGTSTIICAKKKGLQFECEFYGEKNELIVKKDMTAAITEQRAIISAANESDSFIVSMMTRKMMGTTNIYVQDGAIMGKKICSGEFFYNDELEALSKKKKK